MGGRLGDTKVTHGVATQKGPASRKLASPRRKRLPAQRRAREAQVWWELELVAGDITQGGQGGGRCPGFSSPGPATPRQGLSSVPGTQLARSATLHPVQIREGEGGGGS